VWEVRALEPDPFYMRIALGLVFTFHSLNMPVFDLWCLRAEWQDGIILIWEVSMNQPRWGTADDGVFGGCKTSVQFWLIDRYICSLFTVVDLSYVTASLD
jgi:hypothetical protein